MSDYPYVGLKPFRQRDANIFFGREEQIAQILDKLTQTRFVAVFGPSGFGKSSLVMAGVLPSLEAGFVRAPAGSNWLIAIMRPGSQPFVRLAESLADPLLKDNPEHPYSTLPKQEALFKIQATLRNGPLGIVDLLNEAPLTERTSLLVLVDQFEEIFRYKQEGGDRESAAFVALLIESARQAEYPVYIIITMRSDFLGHCTAFLRLPEAINEGQFLIPRLSHGQFQRAIEEPVTLPQFDGLIKPPLANRIMNDAGTHTDQLPLTQHVLMRLWMSRRSNTITVEDYEQMGGFSTILSRHADQALEGLTEEQQYKAQLLFRCLCDRGPDLADVRHPMAFGKIREVLNVSRDELLEIMSPFRTFERSFITPPEHVEITDETVIDITHEALIRQWASLRKWVETEANSGAFYTRLKDTALRWKQGKASLWRGTDLDLALKWKQEANPNPAWAERYGGEFNTAMEFLDNSHAEAQEEERRKREAKEKEAKAEKNRFLLKAAVIALCFVLAFAGWAVVSWIRADKAEQKISVQLFESHLTHASRLAKGEDFQRAKQIMNQTRSLDPSVEPNRCHTRNLLDWFTHLLLNKVSL